MPQRPQARRKQKARRAKKLAEWWAKRDQQGDGEAAEPKKAPKKPKKSEE